MSVEITTTNMLVTFSLQEFNLKKQICSCWEFHEGNSPESSNANDMLIGRYILGELGIIMNFNHHTVTWDTDTFPIKDRGTYTLSSLDSLIDIMFI
jgi:hypothetical protein